MNEATFPLVGTFLVILIVLPVSAVLARVALFALDRLECDHALHERHGARYALLVGSSVGPIAWLLSAGIHQAESDHAARVCAALHHAGDVCFEAGFFALTLGLVVAACALPRLVREQWLVRTAVSHEGVATAARIAAIARANARLAPFADRILVVESSTPVVTLGAFRPRIAIARTFADALDDDAVASVLLHESAHVRGRDPLRYFVAWWAMTINPVGRLVLGRELARWLLAREAHCDREAILDGGAPLALAEAIVHAARSGARTIAPALASPHAEALRFRVELLFAYAEERPHRCCERPSVVSIASISVLLVLLPHGAGTAALDVLHRYAEAIGLALLGA